MRIADRVEIRHSSGVYYPREDSYMLARAVEEVARGDMLDMGTGSGIQGIVAAKAGCRVTFSDIDPVALASAKSNALANGVHGTFIISDLFSKISGRFDTIAFNPPYLPSARQRELALDGGTGGRKYIDRFIAGYKSHLKEGGSALIMESSFNSWHKDLALKGAELISKEHYFFEDLVVLRLR